MSPFVVYKSAHWRLLWLLTALCLTTHPSILAKSTSKRQPEVMVQHCFVSHVIDGDTFICHFSQENEQRVRLIDIDSPERKQPFYHTARKALSAMVEKQIVLLHIYGTDKYHRLLSRVYNTDGKDVNFTMITQGLAWVYHYSDNALYKQAEQHARREKRGLWQDSSSIDPYDYRKQQKKQK
ncbi:thermonuclease family protein [Spirabiliibacterium falconis]|uniref:thermonuclease family protein n=1 Tax=Spirabiliibacterium falconis TaxID=572023 RepID=UPI001AADA917|nr:thermonuclease family protein [Spirabiliibacterium falconis]MBE2894197.1 hypothetical protein [Spirabiliibacterium falconis]